jgi:hypothetical protein
MKLIKSHETQTWRAPLQTLLLWSQCQVLSTHCRGTHPDIAYAVAALGCHFPTLSQNISTPLKGSSSTSMPLQTTNYVWEHLCTWRPQAHNHTVFAFPSNSFFTSMFINTYILPQVKLLMLHYLSQFPAWSTLPLLYLSPSPYVSKTSVFLYIRLSTHLHSVKLVYWASLCLALSMQTGLATSMTGSPPPVSSAPAALWPGAPRSKHLLPCPFLLEGIKCAGAHKWSWGKRDWRLM